MRRPPKLHPLLERLLVLPLPLQPPLRSEFIGILPKNTLVPPHDVGIHPHATATRDGSPPVGEDETVRGDDTLHDHRYGGVVAEGLADDSLEVGDGSGCGVGDGFTCVTGGDVRPDFGLELVEYLGAFEDVVEEGTQGYRRSISTGDYYSFR